MRMLKILRDTKHFLCKDVTVYLLHDSLKLHLPLLERLHGLNADALGAEDAAFSSEQYGVGQLLGPQQADAGDLCNRVSYSHSCGIKLDASVN